MLIEKYGERSTSYAELQSLKARGRGEEAAGEVWRLVAAATREILRSEPL
jgi:hypothetical protein